MNNIIEFQRVTKVFRQSVLESVLLKSNDSRKETRAADSVSFSIEEGDIVGLVGKTGCGKSTLARIAVRLLKPDKGKVLFRGRDINDMKKDEFRLFRSQVRMLFQDPSASLNPHMSVFQIIEEPIKLYMSLNKKERRERVHGLLHEMNLFSCENKYPFTLSGGEKRRVSLARGLSMDPKLIIADEVTSNLDSTTKQLITSILSARNKENNLTILFISHDLSLVKKWCKRLEIMNNGKIVESLTVEDIHKNEVHDSFTKELLSSIIEI